ncbi:hypothetical protein Nepgr_013005 [Nepenthes gracilis]|nr:hypothetical protein Nepgr_013005 [Nepenthes gracilis]
MAMSKGSEFFEMDVETEYESFARPSNAESVAEDENELTWAAIERLPTVNRTHMAFLRRTSSETSHEGERTETIDVTKLDRKKRELVVKKALATAEQDNFKLLLGIKERLNR